MEEQTECDHKKGKNIHCFYFVKIRPTRQEAENEEAEKQYQLMNLARLHISKEIDIQRGYAYDLNKKLAWYDERIESKMREIRNLERYLVKVEHSLPILSVPRTNGFYRLPGKGDRSPVRPDQKRCQEKLVRKGKMDKEYLQQVQEELLSSKKLRGMTSCGKQELNDLIESMEHRIQHGNKKRSDEIKIYREIRSLKETKENYTAPEPKPRCHSYWYSYGGFKKNADNKRSTQSKIDILLDDIGKIKSGQRGRVTRPKAELQLVMKNISCLQRELEKVNSKRLKAYERAYELGQQKKEMKSVYNYNQSLMTQVKELVQKGDVVALKQACDTQVQGFMGHWRDSQAFRNDYENRKLSLRA